MKFILGTFVVIGLYVYEFLCPNFSMWFMAGEIATTMNPSQGAHPKGLHPFGSSFGSLNLEDPDN